MLFFYWPFLNQVKEAGQKRLLQKLQQLLEVRGPSLLFWGTDEVGILRGGGALPPPTAGIVLPRLPCGTLGGQKAQNPS